MLIVALDKLRVYLLAYAQNYLYQRESSVERGGWKGALGHQKSLLFAGSDGIVIKVIRNNKSLLLLIVCVRSRSSWQPFFLFYNPRQN